MQEVFEKIIERFKSEVNYNDGAEIGLKQSIEIVKQASAEYNNGWIPCNERLPEEPEEGLTNLDECDEYIVMIENADIPTALNYVGDGEWYRDGEFYNIIAWQPLPLPFRDKE